MPVVAPHPSLRRLAATLAIAAASLPCAASPQAQPAPPPEPLRSIAALDLPRYMGTWHEIAKYPNRFQAKCTGATSATYALEPAGTVQVVNRCRTASGALDEAVGRARLVGAPGSAVLQVRFAPAWLAWLPLVWGDYWVVDLDPDYRLVAVSEPRREYLWILSRTPQVEPATLDALVRRLEAMGFDAARLQRSPQE